jgi:predicted nucleic acid-binding protein
MLLDSDVVIDVLRQHPPAVAWMAGHVSQRAALPGIVAMDVIQGCRNQRELQRAQRLLSRFRLSWPTAADGQWALDDFARYHLSHRLELLDALIAHTAVGRKEPLATFNVKHYALIAGLQTIGGGSISS